jgi:tRNA (guanine37-N1)-methyltransferase
MMNTFNILTIFPEIFTPVETGIMGRAAENGIIRINKVNIRDFALNKHKNTDDYPYGGGEGMLMTAQPVIDAWKSIDEPGLTVYVSPKGKILNQSKCIDLSKQKNITILCGRYEGIDERIIGSIIDEEISIGDFVISGGETAAMIIIDATARMLPGVLGNAAGSSNESHFNGLLEAPQYTRPEVFEGKHVPKVLLSGNHKKIEEYRFIMSLRETYLKRPDLLKARGLTKLEAEMLINELPEEFEGIMKMIQKQEDICTD